MFTLAPSAVGSVSSLRDLYSKIQQLLVKHACKGQIGRVFEPPCSSRSLHRSNEVCLGNPVVLSVPTDSPASRDSHSNQRPSERSPEQIDNGSSDAGGIDDQRRASFEGI